MQIRLSRNLLCFWMIFPLFMVRLQFYFKAGSSECSMCVALHPNTLMLFGCWCDGSFFTLCHSLQSGAETEQRVCSSCRAVTFEPAEQVWKAWLALRNEAAPPTSSPLFSSTKHFFICHKVSPANKLAQTLFQTSFSCF